MKVNEVTPNVFHLEFPTYYSLGSTLVRFQEFYESIEFKEKEGFSLDEFKSWYIKNSEKGKKYNKFSYYADWDGFNFPSHVLEPFYEGKFNPLNKKELNVLQEFKEKRGSKFYVIGTKNGENNILEHEIAHGLFYTNEKYRNEMLGLMKEIPKEDNKNIENYLIDDYDSSVIEDETHAYLVVDYFETLEPNGIKSPKLKDIHNKMNAAFYRHLYNF